MCAMRRAALIVGALCFAAPAWAEQTAEVERPAATSTVQAIVDDLAGQIERLIGDLPRPRMDLVMVVAARGETASRLRPAIQELLLGAISRGEPLRSVRNESGAAWLDRERARSAAAAQGFELLVWIELSIENNHLVTDGMVFETEHNLWREAVEPERQVLGQLYTRTRVNAELRRYLGPLPSGPLTITPLPLGRGTYLALAVADVDGDDLTELIMLSDRALEVRSVRQGSAEVVAHLKLAGLPRAVTRSRDPIGMLAVGPQEADGRRQIALRTSDYSQGVVVRYDGHELQLSGTVTDFPIRWSDELLCTTMTPGRNTFQTSAIPCGSLEETPTVAPFMAMAEEIVPQPEASPRLAAATAQADGTVVLRWNDHVVARIGTFGTALAISDVNDDGIAEVLLSSDRDPDTGDELTILRLSEDGLSASREQLRDISGSVWVASSGDIDNDGLRELLAISQGRAGAELLVIE